MISKEKQIEDHFINKLIDLKYTYRDDIRDRNALERNFRTKFEALNRVHLTDSEFDRLLEEIIDADVFASSKRLRGINTFMLRMLVLAGRCNKLLIIKMIRVMDIRIHYFVLCNFLS